MTSRRCGRLSFFRERQWPSPNGPKGRRARKGERGEVPEEARGWHVVGWKERVADGSLQRIEVTRNELCAR